MVVDKFCLTINYIGLSIVFHKWQGHRLFPSFKNIVNYNNLYIQKLNFNKVTYLKPINLL